MQVLSYFLIGYLASVLEYAGLRNTDNAPEHTTKYILYKCIINYF